MQTQNRNTQTLYETIAHMQRNMYTLYEEKMTATKGVRAPESTLK